MIDLLSLLSQYWQILVLIVPAGFMVYIYRMGVTFGSIQLQVNKIPDIEKRLIVMETRFEPFLSLLNESVENLFPHNPFGNEIKKKIRTGTATIIELLDADKMIKVELDKGKIDAAKAVLMRYYISQKISDMRRSNDIRVS